MLPKYTVYRSVNQTVLAAAVNDPIILNFPTIEIPGQQICWDISLTNDHATDQIDVRLNADTNDVISIGGLETINLSGLPVHSLFATVPGGDNVNLRVIAFR